MSVLKSLLSSKKAVACAAGVIVTLVAKCGFSVDQETVNSIIALIGTYVLGQSVADASERVGKGKVNQEAAAK